MPEAIHFLDQPRVDWSHDGFQALEAVLIPAYRSQPEAKLLAENVGIPLQEVNFAQNATLFWREILEVAAGRMMLRALVNFVKNEPTRAGLRPQLEELLQRPPELPPTVVAPFGDTEWKLVARLCRERLEIAADGSFGDPGTSPEERIHRWLGDCLPEALLITPSGRPVRDALTQAKRLKSAGWSAQPPPLLTLLEHLSKDEGPLPGSSRDDAKTLIQKVRHWLATPRDEDPCRATQLDNGSVFLNRTALRGHLHDLLQPGPGLLALTIGGTQHSGKSYTQELVQHIAQSHDLRIVRGNLEDSATAHGLAEYLALSLTTEALPPHSGHDDGKRSRYLASWLVQRALEQEQPCWFVIDCCGDHLTPEIQDFVHKLALTLHHDGRDRCRLLLLDYEHGLPYELRKRVETDRARRLEETDLREFFVAFFEKVRDEIGEDATWVDEVVEEIVDEVLGFATDPPVSPEDLGVPPRVKDPFMYYLTHAVETAVEEYTL